MNDNLDPLTAFERLVVGVALFQYFMNSEPENREFAYSDYLVKKFQTGWSYASMSQELECKKHLGQGGPK